MTDDIEIFGSDNVFLDMGLADAEELQRKAILVEELMYVIQERGLTVEQAAQIAEVDKAEIAFLVSGRFHEIGADRLSGMIAKFGLDPTPAK